MCDDAWGTVDASVACRQLGYSGQSKCMIFVHMCEHEVTYVVCVSRIMCKT